MEQVQELVQVLREFTNELNSLPKLLRTHQLAIQSCVETGRAVWDQYQRALSLLSVRHPELRML
jgi:hypothetical protein